jgi:hypothetical protein
VYTSHALVGVESTDKQHLPLDLSHFVSISTHPPIRPSVRPYVHPSLPSPLVSFEPDCKAQAERAAVPQAPAAPQHGWQAAAAAAVNALDRVCRRLSPAARMQWAAATAKKNAGAGASVPPAGLTDATTAANASLAMARAALYVDTHGRRCSALYVDRRVGRVRPAPCADPTASTTRGGGGGGVCADSTTLRMSVDTLKVDTCRRPETARPVRGDRDAVPDARAAETGVDADRADGGVAADGHGAGRRAADGGAERRRGGRAAAAAVARLVTEEGGEMLGLGVTRLGGTWEHVTRRYPVFPVAGQEAGWACGAEQRVGEYRRERAGEKEDAGEAGADGEDGGAADAARLLLMVQVRLGGQEGRAVDGGAGRRPVKRQATAGYGGG